MRDLRDRIVVISGAGSGIGRATALAFARAGARVHLVDIRADRLESALEDIRVLGLQGITHVVDCTDPAAVRDLADEVYAHDRRVDILHNNAGVICAGPVESMPLEDWRWILDINLWGVIHAIHAFVPKMIAQGGGGHIVNTASMAGLVGFPRVVAYSASKFAVVGLSEALSAELAVHGIQVTVLCPGMVHTNLLEGGRLELPTGFRAFLERAFQRYATRPEQVAQDVLEAVRRERFLQMSGMEVLPLWLFKRTAPSLFVGLARRLTTLALRGASA